MKIYFFDNENRYIGNRELQENETIPLNSTIKAVSLKDGEQAHFFNNKWVVSQIEIEEIIQIEPTKSIEERIEEMALQLINAQEALDFLIMGGM
jgi:hypothetical protein